MHCILIMLASLPWFTGGDGSPVVSHENWNYLLQQQVDAYGNVNYPGFKKHEAKLEAYLDELRAYTPQPTWSRAEKMAYWINAYNAFTVRLILDHYPCNSILDLEGGKPFDHSFIVLGGKSYSLNQIEHEILRPQFADPRIHFAVNCASRSCPILARTAYKASTLEQQLQAAAQTFINDPLKNDLVTRPVRISKIFEWYRDDFTRKGNLVDFLNVYATRPVPAGTDITYLEYDWSLNER